MAAVMAAAMAAAMAVATAAAAAIAAASAAAVAATAAAPAPSPATAAGCDQARHTNNYTACLRNSRTKIHQDYTPNFRTPCAFLPQLA